MGSFATIEHRGHPRTLIRGMANHLVGQQRGALNPQVFFVGKDTLSLAILKAERLGAWGAQLEGLLPERPLLGLAFLCHVIPDAVTPNGQPQSTMAGHALWHTDGRREQAWFWRDGSTRGFQPSEANLDVSFLDWHKQQLQR